MESQLRVFEELADTCELMSQISRLEIEETCRKIRSAQSCCSCWCPTRRLDAKKAGRKGLCPARRQAYG
jgi:hypothetical protein